MVYQHTNRPREDDEQAIASAASFQPRARSAKMPQLQMPLPFTYPGEAAPAAHEASTYPDSQSDDETGEEARAKRRNMMNVDERRQLLESDVWCARVEPKRVLCLGCKRWLKLDQRSLYFSGLWLKHRDKCAAIKRLKGEAIVQKKRRRSKGTATKKKAVTARTAKATITRQTRQLTTARIKSEEPAARVQSGDVDPEAAMETQEAQDMAPTTPDAPSASGSGGGQTSPHSQIAAQQAASPPAYGAPASYGHWARIFYPSSRGISPATNTESSPLSCESDIPVAPALHFRYDVDESRISEAPASIPRQIVEDWPNFDHRSLVRDQLQNQIAGGYDATGSYHAQTGLMGPGVSPQHYRPSTINSERHVPSRALTPYDEDDFLYGAEIYDEDDYYGNGVFAPDIPGECPTSPCHHRYRFSTRHELDAYFDGTIIEAIAVNTPSVDPDVMNGAQCLTLLAARIRQRR